jgi:RNA polymerase sigma factor (sigma-70 family)
MPDAPLGTALRHLRRLAGSHPPDGLSDAQLLDRFVRQRDEAAFEALVWRHGGMVLGACRRVLGDAHEAEDAFQATFLVLARKAAAVGRREGLAGWLYGVALRVARKARADAARRRAGERAAAGRRPAAAPGDEGAWGDLRPLLDEELSGLPAKYRVPLLLCYFGGRSKAEAARELDWPAGTVSGRLARGRALLRARLVRRGLTLSGAALAGLLSEKGLSAAVGAALVWDTARAATAPAAAPAVAVAWAGSVLRSLALSRLQGVAALLLAAGLLAAGAGALFGPRPAATGGVPLVARAPAPAERLPRADRFGDPLPPGARARLGTVRFRTRGASWLAFLPGDKALVTAGEDTLSFWDVATGKEARRLAGPGSGWLGALSPDGKALAMPGPENALCLWDVAGGKELRRMRGHTRSIRSVVFSADGRTLVSAGEDGSLRFWDAATGRQFRRFQEKNPLHWVLAVALAPDGQTVATATFRADCTVSLREVATGKEVRQFRVPMPVFQMAFAPDGKTLAVVERANGGQRDSKVHLWDVATGKLRRITVATSHR